MEDNINAAARDAEIEMRVEVEYRLRKRLEAEAYEARLNHGMLVLLTLMPKWLFARIFGDVVAAWRDAQERAHATDAAGSRQ